MSNGVETVRQNRFSFGDGRVVEAPINDIVKGINSIWNFVIRTQLMEAFEF